MDVTVMFDVQNEAGDMVGTVFIDSSKFEDVKNYSWSLNADGYPCAYIDGVMKTLHEFVMGSKKEGCVIDHINHDGCDARRNNLRFVSD